MSKVLLVEDDTALGSTVVDYLRRNGQHDVDWAQDGAKADEQLRHYEYELLILDWELPGKTGLDLLMEYRNRGGQSAALFLTGKSQLNFKTLGLDAGADDYLCKPFDLQELGSRVRALLRRGTGTKSSLMKVSDVTIDTVSHAVRKNGELIALTSLEYSLLEFMARHKGTIFSPQTLLDRVWSSDSDASQDMVRSVIKRIRHKLGESPESSVIKNVVGQGYIVEEN